MTALTPDSIPIRSALLSVYHKVGLEPLVRMLHGFGVVIYSTGGTRAYIEGLGVEVTPVEALTGYPEILDGRVKTLHPAIFGGILARPGHDEDKRQLMQFSIPMIDLVIVDLYPFSATVAAGAGHEEIIEKIDIGGISLIRAAAKNHVRTVVVSSKEQYEQLTMQLSRQGGCTTAAERAVYASEAFAASSEYDRCIGDYLSFNSLTGSEGASGFELRYGENPHQKGYFRGDFKALFEQVNGKELSYNNILDTDAAVRLMVEFEKAPPTFAIIKHNNACGAATRSQLSAAYSAALAADPVSAFGGVLATNAEVDAETAREIGGLFFEIIVAPSFTPEALDLLKVKKNRIILMRKPGALPGKIIRSALNGVLEQDADESMKRPEDFRQATEHAATEDQLADLAFALKLAKHTKSNTIVLVKDCRLLASGTGQTSRVDALKQAIHKANSFGFDMHKAVLASDAFFPFPDCVQIAAEAGITAVVQPGGSVKDSLSVDYCNANGVAMYLTGVRHFRH